MGLYSLNALWSTCSNNIRGLSPHRVIGTTARCPELRCLLSRSRRSVLLPFHSIGPFEAYLKKERQNLC